MSHRSVPCSVLIATLFLVACGSGEGESHFPQVDSGADGSAAFGGTGGSEGDSSYDSPPDIALDALAETTPETGGDTAQDTAQDTANESVPLDGMGVITGHCGILDDEEWNVSLPFLFRNAIDFGADGFVEADLSSGGVEILSDGNLNEGSLHSEVVAFEALYRCELANLIKTENEVDYLDPQGKKTDLLVSIDGYQVGVSVVRAYHHPPSNPYTVADATVLLNKKLSDIPLSTANASPQDMWVRSILHVVAFDSSYGDSIEQAWAQLDDTIRADTIVLVTVTDGNDAFLY